MIVKIDSSENYVLAENVKVAIEKLKKIAPKCTDKIVNVNLSEIKDLNKVKITLNDADDIVFIFAHGAENHVGNFDLENLTNLFENSAGKTFVFISCKSGVKVNNISFAEKFAEKNNCRVLAPNGCSVFSMNGIAVIPVEKENIYDAMQKKLEKEYKEQVLNKMFDACVSDENCNTITWDKLTSLEQLTEHGFLCVDKRPK